MTNVGIVRLGGVSGVLYVVLLIPAYVVGFPTIVEQQTSAQEVIGYFNIGQNAYLITNGLLVIFSAFFFVWFLGILYGVLQRAEGERGGISVVALAGGVMYVALACAAVTAEIGYPATVARFENFQQDAQLVFTSLVLSSWLYHFCQVGTSVLVSAASLVALRTGILPGWLVWAGFAVALLALLHFLFPLLGSLVGLLWVAVVSVLMVARSVAFAGDIASPHVRRVRRS
jgi:hypothetical protein